MAPHTTYTVTIRAGDGREYVAHARASSPGSAVLLAIREAFGPGAAIDPVRESIVIRGLRIVVQQCDG